MIKIPFFEVRPRQLSLTEFFTLFIVAIPLIMILILLCHSLIDYNDRINYLRSETRVQAKKIDNDIDEAFSYTNYQAIYIGKQIAEHGADDLPFIYNLFQKTSGRHYKAHELFSWSLFDWVAPNNLQLVNSKTGIAKNPPDMSNREYTWKSAKNPWTLQVSFPAVGKPSGKWVIPAGTGITDKNGTFLGTIVVGFNIAELTKKIEQSISGSNISFIILDDHYNIVSKSKDNDINPASVYYKNNFKELNLFKDKFGEIDIKDNSQDIYYTHYYKMKDYPYVILTGYNTQVVNKEFYSILWPRIVEFFLIGAFFITLLYFFRRNIVKPITDLSIAAEQVAKGKKLKRIPRSYPTETTYLAKQIVRVMRLMNREKLYKKRAEKDRKKIEELMAIHHEADKEKEDFLNDMANVLKKPMDAIINGSDLARNEVLGHEIHDYKEYFNAMYDAGMQLKCFTTEFLYPELIDIKEIVEKCYKIQRKFAISNDSSLEYKFNSEIPQIWGDKLRLRQVILSTVYHSLLYCPKGAGATINISTERLADGEPTLLVIKVEDNGWGYDEKMREDDWQIRFGNENTHSMSRNPDMMKLSISTIRHIVQLHHGAFEIQGKSGSGSIFSIRIPYQSKENLYIHPDEYAKLDKDNKSNPNKTTVNDKNVIKFPVS